MVIFFHIFFRRTRLHRRIYLVFAHDAVFYTCVLSEWIFERFARPFWNGQREKHRQ
jgi:hypothetical protein